MCFAPQRRALFRHRNFQKWSEHGVFCTFWLRNVLRATTTCTFSTSQLPKAVRIWGVLYILWLLNVLRATTACNFSSLIWPAGSAPAALASLLFDPPEPQIIGKTQCFATFLPFRASASSFFWLFLFSDLLIFLFSLPLPCSAFHLSILLEVWLLNFLRIYDIIPMRRNSYWWWDDHAPYTMFWPWCLWHVRAMLVKTVKIHLVKVSGGLQCCIWGPLKPTVSRGSISWNLLLSILLARKHTMKHATYGPSVLCSWRCWVAGSETLSSAGGCFSTDAYCTMLHIRWSWSFSLREGQGHMRWLHRRGPCCDLCGSAKAD